MTWKIKNTGKIQNLLIMILFSIGIYILFVIYATIKEGGNFWENAIGSFLILFIFIIVWIFTIPKLILRKRIPLRIEINSEIEELILSFPKSKSQNLKKDKFAYSYHKKDLYSVLVIYKKIKASRGHILYHEYLSIVGHTLGVGWKNKNLQEITKFLKRNEFEHYEKGKDKSFIIRMLEE